MWNRSIVNLIAGAACCLGAGAINLQAKDDGQGPSPTFSIGGSVEGMTAPVVLQNSNGTLLIVPRDGAFTFETRMVPSAIYNVTVPVAQGSQSCRVHNGAGTVQAANISDVSVVCTPNTYTAGIQAAREFP